MNINSLILRNLKKNLRNYYLYVFALIFSSGLYFAFVTLQYDKSMDPVEGSVKGSAGIGVASILLIAIVAVFLLYANMIFIKQRSKEIGLFQLIGMTKNRVFGLLSAENAILYFGSLVIGVALGFVGSKLLIMILFKITGVEGIASLSFSPRALLQTFIVFLCVYMLILLMNLIFIKRQTILSLFRVKSQTEMTARKLSVFQVVIGIFGIAFIAAGYILSGKLFDGDFSTMVELFGAMILILFSVILGTYLFYKGSVAFLVSLIRKQKGGYLNIKQVLSLSSIMFRMKSNAALLTIITTVSALAIGLLSLSYITYYSAESAAYNHTGGKDFSLLTEKDAEAFRHVLDEANIAYTENKAEVYTTMLDIEDILQTALELNFDASMMETVFISEDAAGLEVAPGELKLTGYNEMLQRFMSLKSEGDVTVHGKDSEVELHYTGLQDEYPISNYYTMGGLPTMVVDETVFEQLKQDLDPELARDYSMYFGYEIEDKNQLDKANKLFNSLALEAADFSDSRINVTEDQKSSIGLVLFIVGFLGLTFLVTSGCILYFKQMDEAESEKPNYTILRKLGFTTADLRRGIQRKQLFNFGIPLVIGLFHSYFAVQSGWFLFGTSMLTPMIIVMVIYTVLYSIFGILSVVHYNKVIKNSL
ncbi:bacitracin transport system permease protein [Terribacillus aidingensis]|uniref:Bacitracin transport system permease protein n=1 Tax=Terribacillus aidingensis TaxID=586416 RepID=A0A285MZN1_9BACI|nr:ABC transporter permease [Terribacillus aidingensis]SNZ02538.1 bacitracin transport system permease protein [Terribacillus aidingensis]